MSRLPAVPGEIQPTPHPNRNNLPDRRRRRRLRLRRESARIHRLARDVHCVVAKRHRRCRSRRQFLSLDEARVEGLQEIAQGSESRRVENKSSIAARVAAR